VWEVCDVLSICTTQEQRKRESNTSMIDVHNGQVSVVLACDVRP
jgi:hypothetical protein